MLDIRVLWSLLVVVVSIFVSSSIGQAKSLRDILDGEESISTASESLLADLSAYYRHYSKVRLGRESRLANGVAWRLHTDLRSGLSVPRLTWMPDRDRLRIANKLFDAIHSELLAWYEYQEIEYRTGMLYGWEGEQWPFLIRLPFYSQEKVAVTYAGARLVSYVETGRAHQFVSFGLKVRGLVLDLDWGRVSRIESCKGRKNGFRFGKLLHVCDDESLERFFAIWVNEVEIAAKRARDQGDERSANCAEGMRPLDSTDRIDTSWIELYLTPGGLAVFNRDWVPTTAKSCAFDDITTNPIVIPYGELEHFMKPGLWRDELLRQ